MRSNVNESVTGNDWRSCISDGDGLILAVTVTTAIFSGPSAREIVLIATAAVSTSLAEAQGRIGIAVVGGRRICDSRNRITLDSYISRYSRETWTGTVDDGDGLILAVTVTTAIFSGPSAREIVLIVTAAVSTSLAEAQGRIGIAVVGGRRIGCFGDGAGLRLHRPVLQRDLDWYCR